MSPTSPEQVSDTTVTSGEGTVHTIELTDEELKLVREAVRSFLDDFGADERELVRALVAILQKFDVAAATSGGAADDVDGESNPAP